MPLANMNSKDPTDWSVEEVVDFICHQQAGSWSQNLPCPDLVALEKSLRDNFISGKAFLKLDYGKVKDLGVTGIGYCQYVLDASEWLQQQSSKFISNRQPLPNRSMDRVDLRVVPAAGEKLPRRVQPTLVSGPYPIHSLDARKPHDSFDSNSASHSRLEPTCTIHQQVDSDFTPHQTAGPNPALGSDSWYDNLLRLYPPNENEEEDALPLLGESGSEFDYDSETRHEMEEDQIQESSGIPQQLALDEFNAVIDQYIADGEENFTKNRLPKELHKAFGIWSKGKSNAETIDKISKDLAHLEKRLGENRKALLVAEHTSRESLLKACACMDFTVSDICFKKWQISVVNQSQAPEKLARVPRGPRAAKPNHDSDGDETLDSDSGSISAHGREEDLGDEFEQVEDPDHWEEYFDSESSSDAEEADDFPDEHRKRSRSGPQTGPFRYSSSPDDDLDYLILAEEDHSHRVAKKRRLERNSPHENDFASPGMSSQGPLPYKDVPLPSKEGADDTEMETRADPLNRSQSNSHESLNSEIDPIGSDDRTALAMNAFAEVSSISWDSIEHTSDRFYLIAKALICLTKSRAEQFSKFLTEFVPCIYRDTLQDALMAISEDKVMIEGMETEQSHSAMLLATLFISWVNIIRIPDKAIPTDQAKIAIVAAKENSDKEDEFIPFWDCLSDLIKAYMRWLSFPPEIQLEKRTQDIRRQRRTDKLVGKRVTLNRAQKEGQERQDQQDAAKRALLEARVAEGVLPSNITEYAISFGDPIIYLDPHIGRFIKNHQLVGIQFLFREIVENKGPEGCLLAHTMGLGKTMQVISLLVTISTAGASQDLAIRDQIPKGLRQSKTLILCPAALVENWCKEFAMWSPGSHNLGIVRSIPNKTTRGAGSDRNNIIRSWKDDGGVLILSYSIFRNLAGDNANKGGNPAQQAAHDTVKFWLLDSPSLVVADEAQMLRTQESQIATTASRFRTHKRIALTGTPISNGLKDYYWMVDWVAPRYLGTFPDFREKFIHPIENGSHTESNHFERRHALQRQELLSRIIRPKVQRMDMSALSTELPPKNEFSVYIELTNFQKAAYNLFVDSVKQGNVDNVNQQLMSWLSLLQLCSNHPALFKAQLEIRKSKPASSEQTGRSYYDHTTLSGLNMPVEEQILPNSMLSGLNNLFNEVPNPLDHSLSSRVLILNEILIYASSVGDKVLVFSSSIPTLNYLGQFMEKTHRKYCRIDGTVNAADRYEMMNNFNRDPTINVFLISTHAGGLGLNIQTANRVVIFDFMFNPTWEEQAVGRAYRIGQKKPVFVYRLVAAGTFEERLYGTTVFKSQLARRLVDHKNVTREGSKSSRDYLAPCTESSHEGGIDVIAMAKDFGMMTRLSSVECAKYIARIKLSSDEVDPNDCLTSAERQTVEDELQLRRLHLEDSTAPAITSMTVVAPLPEKPPV